MDPQLESRLTALEKRIAKLEKTNTPFPAANGAPPKSGAKSPASQKQIVPDIERKPGNWLGIIAVICFVLAAGFMIKLSIESGWLTPERQIALAAMFGFSLIGAGLALSRADREYAGYLPGAGVIVLYLAVFAAYRLYALVPFGAALSLVSLISTLCIWLYWKIKHDVYPITAAAGSYIAPIILGIDADTTFSLFYFLICSVAFAIISIWMRTRTLTLVSSYLAIVMTALVGLNLHEDVLVASLLGVNFIVFAVGTYLYTQANDAPLNNHEAWSFMPVLLIFYAAEYYYIDHIQIGLAPWVSLGFAAFLLTIYAVARSFYAGNMSASRPVVLAYSAIVAFHSVYLNLLPDDCRPWLFVVILTIFAFASGKLANADRDKSLYVPILTLLAIVAIEYLTMLYHLLDKYDPSWLAVSLVAVASMWLVLVVGDEKVLRRGGTGQLLLGSAHFLAIVALYRLTTDHGSLAVSASWLLYAVCVMAYAIYRKDEMMAKSALFVLGFAAAKALLRDAASAPTVIRIFCLLLTGAVLYGCGFFMRKVTKWKKEA
jgi:uncharacterized membrane protein